jgi:hypothetical protein
MKRRLVVDADIVEGPEPKRARLLERLDEGEDGGDEWAVVAQYTSLATRFSLSLTCRALRRRIPWQGALMSVLVSAMDEDESPGIYAWAREMFDRPVVSGPRRRAPLPLSAVFYARTYYLAPLHRAIIAADLDYLDRARPALTVGACVRIRRVMPSDQDYYRAIEIFLREILCGDDDGAAIIDWALRTSARYFPVSRVFDYLVNDETSMRIPLMLEIATKCMRCAPSLACNFLVQQLIPWLSHAINLTRDEWNDPDKKACCDLLIELHAPAPPDACDWCRETVRRDIVPAFALLRDGMYEYMLKDAAAGHKSDAWWAAFREIDRMQPPRICFT